MIALDTNMLVRLYVDDGDRQSARQREIVVQVFEQADRLFVPKTVLLEMEWVLRGYYKFSQSQIGAAFAHLLGLANLDVEDEAVVRDAVRYYQQGLDFADALHAASSARCKRLLTFDRRFASRSRRAGVAPKVEVAG